MAAMTFDGTNAREFGVNHDEDRLNDTKTLHRMIAYLRGEALRLRIMDVALLLEHAEDAVVGFSLGDVQDRGRVSRERQRGAAEH